MDKILAAFEIAFLICAIFGIAVFGFATLKKNMISVGASIQCSSGDSEVMTFNVNFFEGEDEESKQGKLKDAFDRIDHRRAENHAKWLKIKAEAMAENEAAEAEGKDLKLRSVTQENAPT